MRALIVDDSRFLRERLKGILAPLGWSFAEAAHGGEAMAILSGVCGFELMLLDINMPVMGGLECLRQVRARIAPGAMKIMMVTTEADAGFIADALSAGADEFLMKPMASDTVEAKLLLMGFTPRMESTQPWSTGSPAS